MFKWISKSWNKFVDSFVVEEKKIKTIAVRDLQNKTKKELEKIGRKIGIELDRRLTKTKLINKTYVSTDNDEISKISESCGAHIIERPKNISSDFSKTPSNNSIGVLSIPEFINSIASSMQATP
mgnify:CR=1 FL=1